LPLLAHSFTLSAAALFGQSLQTVSPDTVILTIPLSPGEPPLQVTLHQMMDIYKDPGFSAAIIEHSRAAWAKGFGVTTPGGNTPVTPAMLFQEL
jgi:CubicO group peptidase (beta-lactamase class C family)